MAAVALLEESTDDSVYRAVGRLVLIGTRLVTIEVGGETLPSEDVIQRFMNTFRVEGQPGKSEAVAHAASEPQPTPPQPEQASSASVQPEPSPLSLTARMQAALLKPGVLQYQSIQEKLPGEGMPWSFSVGTAKRRNSSASKGIFLPSTTLETGDPSDHPSSCSRRHP